VGIEQKRVKAYTRNTGYVMLLLSS